MTIDATPPAWSLLRRRLDELAAGMQEEVRSYPTPIARCDIQLTQVVEDCAEAFRRVRVAEALHAARATLARDAWQAQLRDFATALSATPDEPLASACRRLLQALAH
jgi:hypothetical protein